MKPQFILGVLSSYLQTMSLKQGMNAVDLLDFEHEATANLVIGQRERLEQDESVRQILPYVLMYTTDPDGTKRFITYRRGKGVGESRLSGNVSIGFGGHVDLDDVVTAGDSVVDLRATVTTACERELAEEVLIMLDGAEIEVEQIFPAGLITDNSDAVGRVHLGLVMVAELHPNVVVTCREAELEMLEPMTANELMSSGLPIENWTKIILRAYLGELE